MARPDHKGLFGLSSRANVDVCGCFGTIGQNDRPMFVHQTCPRRARKITESAWVEQIQSGFCALAQHEEGHRSAR